MEHLLGKRLQALVDGGSHGWARALWIETLSPQEALAELFGRRDDLSLLQRARFLLDLSRHDDAREVLSEVQGASPGLQEVRDEFLSALAATVEEPEAQGDEGEPALVSRTLAELHARQGDVEAAVEIYRGIVAQDPEDRGARQRLRELLGAEQPQRPEEALATWLGRVRRWRGELGV